MTDDADARDGRTDRPGRLLPGLGPASNASLERALRVLRDTATDPAVRDRVDDVLAGPGSLRDLARDDGFGALVGPLAERGWQRWQAQDDDARRAAEQAAADLAEADRTQG